MQNDFVYLNHLQHDWVDKVPMYTHKYCMYVLNCIQWNLSNPDTNGAAESVIVSEVSSFQRLKEWYTIILWVGKGVLVREAFGNLTEGFDCICSITYTVVCIYSTVYILQVLSMQ